MKQIFDWLREQINEGREFEHDERNECFNYGLDYAIRRVDEAEAKWESKCCEWKQEKILEFSLSDCVTSCGHAEHYSVGIDKYCRFAESL